MKNAKILIVDDEILIKVNTKPKIFIPNIFSPNNDNINDDVIITSGIDIAKIYSFQVYDRWGSMVSSVQNIPVSDNIAIWDGTFNGKKLNPGVFVYKIEFEQINGIRHIQTGDITLLK